MSTSHVVARSLHDAGLGLWFGGSTMGAVGLNGSTTAISSASDRLRASHRGWSRWAPVQAAAIGGYLVGSVRLLQTDAYRVAGQQGVGSSSAAKTALTAAALGATAWSGLLNRRLAGQTDAPVAGATEPASTTPPDVARSLKQLKVVQWLIPALTGALTVVTAVQAEQQRPSQVAGGIVRRLIPFA